MKHGELALCRTSEARSFDKAIAINIRMFKIEWGKWLNRKNLSITIRWTFLFGFYASTSSLSCDVWFLLNESAILFFLSRSTLRQWLNSFFSRLARHLIQLVHREFQKHVDRNTRAEHIFSPQDEFKCLSSVLQSLWNWLWYQILKLQTPPLSPFFYFDSTPSNEPWSHRWNHGKKRINLAIDERKEENFFFCGLIVKSVPSHNKQKFRYSLNCFLSFSSRFSPRCVFSLRLSNTLCCWMILKRLFYIIPFCVFVDFIRGPICLYG